MRLKRLHRAVFDKLASSLHLEASSTFSLASVLLRGMFMLLGRVLSLVSAFPSPVYPCAMRKAAGAVLQCLQSGC